MKCPECNKLMVKNGEDFECGTGRCPIHHKEERCKECGKPPAEYVTHNMRFWTFKCEDGHPMEIPSKPVRV
jgi:hypothetical protein